jgi:hypothetical protein
MKEITEEKLPKPVLHGFLFGNGMLLTPDEMKIAERYGFLFSNGMILTPSETKIMENLRVIHATTIKTKN